MKMGGWAWSYGGHPVFYIPRLTPVAEIPTLKMFQKQFVPVVGVPIQNIPRNMFLNFDDRLGTGVLHRFMKLNAYLHQFKCEKGDEKSIFNNYLRKITCQFIFPLNCIFFLLIKTFHCNPFHLIFYLLFRFYFFYFNETFKCSTWEKLSRMKVSYY